MTSRTKPQSIGGQQRVLEQAVKRIRRDAEPEDFHVARGGKRRLRSALRVLEETHDDRAHRRAIEVRRLGRGLGRVRDLDVVLERVKELAVGSLAEGTSDLDAFMKMVHSTRAKARRRVVRMLESKEFDRLQRKLRALDDRVGSSGNTVARLGGSLVLARGRRLLTLELDPRNASQEDLHRYRIRVKRFRYTLELAKVASEHLEPLLAGAKHLQDQLGLLNDGFVVDSMVKEFMAKVPSTRGSVAFESLLTACREGQVRRRSELPEPLASFRTTLDAFIAEQERRLAPAGPSLASVRTAVETRRRAKAS